MRIIKSLKRGNGKRDVDREWDGRKGGIKQREGLWNQNMALVILREEGQQKMIYCWGFGKNH